MLKYYLPNYIHFHLVETFFPLSNQLIIITLFLHGPETEQHFRQLMTQFGNTEVGLLL